MAAVKRLADALDFGGADNPEVRAYTVGALRKEAAALKALVADVRAAGTAEEGDSFGVEPRPVPLLDLLEDARVYAESLPGNHPVGTFFGEAEAGAVVRVDPERVGQVLRNLLSNAAKHSPDGVPIELRARRRGDASNFGDARGGVLLEVADRGGGIHPDDAGRIFEKFGRGRHTQARGVKGAGLGLYISRRILEDHGSELHVRSTLGEGSVFSFELEEIASGAKHGERGGSAGGGEAGG